MQHTHTHIHTLELGKLKHFLIKTNNKRNNNNCWKSKQIKSGK